MHDNGFALTRVEIGNLLLTSGVWHATNFPPVELKVPVDWSMDPFKNRTWQWQLHLFDFIPPLLAFDKKHEVGDGALLACQLFADWFEQNADRRMAARMAWHDHATALRADNLLTLMDAKPPDVWFNAHITGVLVEHARVLTADSFYTRDSNHGLDQGLALYALAHRLADHPEAGQWLAVAVERINYEVSRAFCDDGGHVENSVDYQRFGLNQVRKIVQRGQLYEGARPSIGLPDRVVDAAAVALTHMIAPNGYAPAVGDSPYIKADGFLPKSDPIASSIQPHHYQHMVYACTGGKKGSAPTSTDLVLEQSGWASLRSNWTSSDAVHCLFRCGYLSDAHRRDDDLSIYVHAFGQEWLISGGIFKYDYTHPMRLHVCSHEAHTLSAPVGATAIRQLALMTGKSRITHHALAAATSTVEGSTEMYDGFRARRRVTLFRPEPRLDIRDELTPKAGGEHQFVSRFLIPGDRAVRVLGNNIVEVASATHLMCIETDHADAFIQLRKGESKPRHVGWRSTRSGQIEPAWSVEFLSSGPQLSATFHVTWKTRD